MYSKVAPVINQLGKASVFCKSLYVVLLIGYAISFSDTLFHGLAIIPNNLLPPNFWLWTLVTYFIVEKNVLILLLDFFCVHICGTVLEPLWSPLELVKYLAVVNLCVGLASTVFLLLLYFFVTDTELIFSITIHGLSGFVGALLVAVKQIVPDSTLLQTPLGRLKNTHLPGLVFLVASILALCQVLKPIVLCLYITGAYSGWVYLRFYQPHQNGSQGDFSDHFTLASFFPSGLQPPLEMLSGICYRVALRLRLCKPAIRHLDVGQLHAVTVNLPGVDPQDAERRRLKALKDLTERLNRSKDLNVPAWPQMDSLDSASSVSPATHVSPAIPREELLTASKAETSKHHHHSSKARQSPAEEPSDPEEEERRRSRRTGSSGARGPKLVLHTSLSGSETDQ